VPQDYRIHLDDKYGALNKIDIPAEVEACSDAVVPTGDSS